MNGNTSFASRLKRARNLVGISQVELARRAQMTSPTICHYEQGKVRPTIDSLFLLSSALGVPAAWLLGEQHPREEKSINPWDMAKA